MAGFDPVSYMMGQKAAGGGGGGGSSTLAGLTDVDISNPTNGQTLVYNATSGKWENGGYSGSVFFIHWNEGLTALDKTAKEILDAINAGKRIVLDSDGGSIILHSYDPLVKYGVDDVYFFDFVEFQPAGRDAEVTYYSFETETENGYPVYVQPEP